MGKRVMGIGGWLAAVFLLISAAPALAERVSVSVPLANVRSGPGTGYKVLWQLERHHPLRVIKTNGPWIYFSDYEGDKGWIHRDIVSAADAVIVTRESVNVRSGPGTDHDIAFTAARGVPFRALERREQWIRIRHADGEAGWIHRMLVW
jgi:SH3-like domain-containing protein